MRRLAEPAARAKRLLEQAGTPLGEECMQVLRRELTRTLQAYFELTAPVSVTVERGGELTVTVCAKASRARSFGVVRG